MQKRGHDLNNVIAQSYLAILCIIKHYWYLH